MEKRARSTSTSTTTRPPPNRAPPSKTPACGEFGNDENRRRFSQAPFEQVSRPWAALSSCTLGRLKEQTFLRGVTEYSRKALQGLSKRPETANKELPL